MGAVAKDKMESDWLKPNNMEIDARERVKRTRNHEEEVGPRGAKGRFVSKYKSRCSRTKKKKK